MLIQLTVNFEKQKPFDDNDTPFILKDHKRRQLTKSQYLMSHLF